MSSEDSESSEDEFFDAEDKFSFEDTRIINNLETGCKLVEGLDVSELLRSDNGLQFEISEDAKPLNEDGSTPTHTVPSNGTIFRNPITRAEKTQSKIDISYDEIEKDMTDITDCGGIKKLVLQNGFGNFPSIGEVVQVKYMIFLEGLDEPVDSHHAFKKSIRFKLGSGSVISVLDYGVRTMVVGETSKFLAKPEFAYGALGVPSKIPPDTRIMLTIQLASIVDTKNITIGEMGSSQRCELPFEQLYDAAVDFKQQGNQLFKNNKYRKAIRRYKVAVKIMVDATPSRNSEAWQKKWELMCILHTNKAQCLIILENFDDAIKECKSAIEISGVDRRKKRKTYFRYAKALFEKGEVSQAKEIIKNTAKDLLDLYESDVHQLYHQIKSKTMQDNEKSKSLARKMFSN